MDQATRAELSLELVVVGSGTAVPDGNRVGSAYFVQGDSYRVLLDCGPGAVHHLARFAVPWPALTHLCLSHFHTDHVGDVGALFFAFKYGQAQPRTEPLTVYGPGGTARFFRKLADAMGDYLDDRGFPLEIVELAVAERVALGEMGHISALATPHTDASVAFRIDGPHSSLGYTGDTGESSELGAFFQGVDLLITECSLPDELAMDSHLTPTRVATLARAARPKRLLISHIYPQLPRSEVIQLVRTAGWDGAMLLAEDGLKLEI